MIESLKLENRKDYCAMQFSKNIGYDPAKT